MSLWGVSLSIFAVVGFIADMRAILKNERRQSIAFLVLFAMLGVLLVLQQRHAGQIEAENQELKALQVRAQNAIDDWSYGDGTSQVTGQGSGGNRGIVVATADLLEDGKECRPGAYSRAQERLAHADEQAATLEGQREFGAYTSTDYDLEDAIEDLWIDAASDAYAQIEGIAANPPVCE